MTVWSKIVLRAKFLFGGAKFLFGGFESATDYLLKLLNDFLSKGKVADRIQEAREYVASVLGYMRKYEKYCPAIWAPHYEKLEAAVQTLLDVFEDNKVTPEELEKSIVDINAAIAEWMK